MISTTCCQLDLQRCLSISSGLITTPPTRSLARLPARDKCKWKKKRKKGTRNKQQYNNRIFLGLISFSFRGAPGEKTRLPLFIVASLFSARRHSIKHSSSRRPKECHHQSASALNCQSAASPLFTRGSFSPFPSYLFFSFDLLFISVSPPCPFSSSSTTVFRPAWSCRPHFSSPRF